MSEPKATSPKGAECPFREVDIQYCKPLKMHCCKGDMPKCPFYKDYLAAIDAAVKAASEDTEACRICMEDRKAEKDAAVAAERQLPDVEWFEQHLEGIQSLKLTAKGVGQYIRTALTDWQKEGK